MDDEYREMTSSAFREIRKKQLSMTQAELAEELGCSRAHIISLEDRVTVPPVYAAAILHLLEKHGENAVA